jgi:hypothetical protein
MSSQPPPTPSQQPPGGFGAPQEPNGRQGSGSAPPPQPGHGDQRQPVRSPQAGSPYGQDSYAHHPSGQDQFPYGPAPGTHPTQPQGGVPGGAGVSGGPGGPGGPGGEGAGGLLGIIAAAVAVAVVVAGVGYLLLSGSRGVHEAGSGGRSSSPAAGAGAGAGAGARVGGAKPAHAEAKKLFALPAPRSPGSEPVDVSGGWATASTFAKATLDAVEGVSINNGVKQWTIPLSGEICAASKWKGDGDRTAVITRQSKSAEAPCSQMAVIDLDTGKKVWQKTLPPSGNRQGGGMSVTISHRTVAAAWAGGAAGYGLSGHRLWKDQNRGACSDVGYAGGQRLVAIVRCAGYPVPTYRVERFDPVSGRTTWRFRVPQGVESVRVASTKPLALVTGAGASAPTDVMTVGDGAVLKAKIPLGGRYATGCGTQAESCNGMAVGKDAVYLPSKEHRGSSGHGRTNEIRAFDSDSGRPTWKSPAGQGRTMVPIRMSGSHVIAYKPPTSESGGEIVGIEPKAGAQRSYLRMPAGTAKEEGSIPVSTRSVRAPVVFAYGRLVLQEGLMSGSGMAKRPLAIGFGD